MGEWVAIASSVLAASGMVGTLRVALHDAFDAEQRRRRDAERQSRTDGARRWNSHGNARSRRDRRARARSGSSRLRRRRRSEPGPRRLSRGVRLRSRELLRRARATEHCSASRHSSRPRRGDLPPRHEASVGRARAPRVRRGPERRRLDDELDEIEDRLAGHDYADERSPSPRRAAASVAPSPAAPATTTACATRARSDVRGRALRRALAEAHIELASVRAGDTQVDVDAVVETLQETIRRVREVQDELRRLGY